MKYIMSFENYNNDILTLYRSTDYDEPLSQKYIFLSESKDFASDYGKNLYQIKIQPKKIFNSLDESDMRKLFDLLGEEGLSDQYNDTTYYSFEEMDEKYPMWSSDTWEMIEDEIYYVSDYDCALITEGGYENYVVFNSDIITDVKKLDEPLTENRKIRNTANKIIQYITRTMSREKLRSGLNDFASKVKAEGGEYKDVAKILETYYATGYISKEQGDLIKRKLADSFKLSVLAGIWLLPGGSVWSIAAIKLCRRFGIQLLPNNLEKKKKNDEIS